MTPTAVVIQVSKDPADPNYPVPHADRVGHCLEFSMQYVLANDGCTLVHGSIFHPVHSEQRIGHAWVEGADGSVFDPTLGARFLPGTFELFANPIVDRRYTKEQATILMLTHDHHGIWYPLEEASGVWGDDVGK